LTDQLRERLETLYGPHRLAYELGRQRSTIYGVLRRERLSRLSFIDRPTRTVVRYERDRPGELLHVDVKKLGRIREGGGWKMHGREMGTTGEMKRIRVGYDYLHVAVDDNGRVAFVQALADEKAPTCAQFVRDATAYFASLDVTIERVMTDKRATTPPRRSSRKPWTNWASATGAPGSLGPDQLKAERCNRTLLEEFASNTPFNSNDQRLQALGPWLHSYNGARPHTAIGGLTPLQRLRQQR